MGWRSFETSTLDVHQEVPALLADSTASLDWEDSLQLKLALRAGYAYISTPVPDHTLEPSNPDADLHNLSVGIGYRTGGWTPSTGFIV